MRNVALYITLCDVYTTGYNAYYTQFFYIAARGSPFEGGGGVFFFYLSELDTISLRQNISNFLKVSLTNPQSQRTT